MPKTKISPIETAERDLAAAEKEIEQHRARIGELQIAAKVQRRTVADAVTSWQRGSIVRDAGEEFRKSSLAQRRAVAEGRVAAPPPQRVADSAIDRAAFGKFHQGGRSRDARYGDAFRRGSSTNRGGRVRLPSDK
jgi:hypothetical protein